MKMLQQRTVGVIGVLAAWIALVTAAPASQKPSRSETPVVPKNATALEGVPEVRLDATRDGTTRRELDGAEATKQELKITIVNGQYYWASRGNRPLRLSSSGEFSYLSSAEPGQYIRFRRVNDRIAYVEHVDMAFGSVTYWGELRIILGK